jgi:hypothetical protein
LCPQWLTGRPCSGALDFGASFIPGVSTGIDVATVLSGQNPLTGERVGLVGRGVALAGVLTPLSGGQVRGVARGLGDISGGSATVEEALEGGIKWLGDNYREISNGVFRSKDGTRQFRMKIGDLTDAKQGPHVHFESIGPDGRRITENSHVKLKHQ